MAIGSPDPFDALFRFQRALDQQLNSDWLEDVTTAVNEGAYAGRWPELTRVRELADRLS